MTTSYMMTLYEMERGKIHLNNQTMPANS